LKCQYPIFTQNGCRSAGNAGAASVLVQLQRQAVGVGKEDKAASGVLVDADFLDRHAARLELGLAARNVIDREGQMAQAAGFGAGRPCRRLREGEQLDLAAIG
jgi:hypothetical protein